MPRLRSSVPRPCSASVLVDFYRQELLKHRECLEQQREYFSARAIEDAEAGLMRLLAQLDQLCAKEDAQELVGAILRKYDVVTRLSAMSDPGLLH